jgi:hypothetical protein
MRLGIGAAPTRLTLNPTICAVKFDEQLRRTARFFVQPIDVLRHDGEKFAGALKLNDSSVGARGSRIPETFPAFGFEIPVLDASSFGAHKIVIIHRLKAFPDALGTAEVGDAAGGGDSCACEEQNS